MKTGVGKTYYRVQQALEPFGSWDMIGLAHTGKIDGGFPRKTLGFNATHAHDRTGADILCKNVSFFKVPLYAGGYIELPDDPETIVLAATLAPGRVKDRAVLATEPFDVLEERECDYTVSYEAFRTLRSRRPDKRYITVDANGEKRVDVRDLASDAEEYNRGRDGLDD